MKRPVKKLLLFLLYLFIQIHSLLAQDIRSSSLKELLQLAEANYPLLKSRKFEVQAAKKDVEASKASIIPSLDASYQLNYATYNNITGMAYPQFLVPNSMLLYNVFPSCFEL